MSATDGRTTTPDAVQEQEPEEADHQQQRTNTIGRRNSVAQSVQSITQGVTRAAGNLLQKDAPLGFSAATASAVSQAPTIAEIRKGSFTADGWHPERQIEHRRRTLSSTESGRRRSLRTPTSEAENPIENTQQTGITEAFPVLTEEPTEIGDAGNNDTAPPAFEAFERPFEGGPTDVKQPRDNEASQDANAKHHGHHRIKPLHKEARVYTSGYIPPPVVPWTSSTVIGLKAFWRWFLTPFGFFVTLYGLNVVAWGGMLFLLLCNASPQMCWSPVPTDETRLSVAEQRSPVASLELKRGAQLYNNCNDINSPRRIWLEIDSQILNALFCVTGFGLIPWRFRDLYYLLKWRLKSERKHGRIAKLYGLRVLAGFYRNWVRLPGSDTLDEMSLAEYNRSLAHATTNSSTTPPPQHINVENSAGDPRLPLPLSKSPDDPLTSIRAPPTRLWVIDFFVWSQAINTFFQVALCGVMYGYNRYTRPGWATGLLIALACIIAGAGGWMSFKEGRKVKRVEGVRAAQPPGNDEEANMSLEQTRTGHESWHLGDRKEGDKAS